MAKFNSYANATLATVLQYLEDQKIGEKRIVAMYYDGSLHNAVWSVDQ